MPRYFWLLTLLIVAGCDSADPIDDELGTYVLPAPTGAYAVGTTTKYVVDATRDDGYTAAVGDARELMVQVWYPTDDADAADAEYLNSTVTGLFSVTQDYLSVDSMATLVGAIQTHSQVDAAVAVGGPYPVVFFSHGLGGVRGLYTTFIEDLASHGYIVVGTDHTYGAFATVFPDGRVFSIKTSGTPAFRDVVQIWADDLVSVLNEVEQWNATDPRLSGAFNLSLVGATGHSTGGSAAVQVHTFDDRFKVAVSLDAPQVGDAADGEGMDNPLMMLFASPSDYASPQIADRIRTMGYSASIAQTSHYSFTDLPSLLAIGGVSAARAAASTRPPGTLDPARLLDIIQAYSKATFDRHLLGTTEALLDGPSGQFPEVTFQVLIATEGSAKRGVSFVREPEPLFR